MKEIKVHSDISKKKRAGEGGREKKRVRKEGNNNQGQTKGIGNIGDRKYREDIN